MKVLYYDCFAGISGDMNIGALIDVGVPKEYLLKELSKLNIEGEYSLEIIPSSKMGIHGTKFTVKYDHVDHHHRHLSHIEKIIMESELSDEVKNISMNIFKRVAEAEAKIHNTSIEKVHFHEVGAVDSIIDVVGGAICLDYLKIDKVYSSPVQLGGGFVKCAHGLFPVPAPATLEIIKNIPINLGKVMHEATTPTGAAIIAEVSKEFIYPNNLKVLATGYGIGGRDVEIPNVLRVLVGEI
jgi:uncharacterized protein (TIGR00299 family) protein